MSATTNEKKSDYLIGAILFVIGVAVAAAAVGIGMVRNWSFDASVMGSVVGLFALLFIGSAAYFVFSQSRAEYERSIRGTNPRPVGG